MQRKIKVGGVERDKDEEKILRDALNIHKTFAMKENLADSNPGGRLEIC